MSKLFKETFSDFPILQSNISERFELFLPNIIGGELHGVMITGTCKGNIINKPNETVFFKAAYDPVTLKYLENESMIFKTLGEHKFIPKYYGTRQYGKYKILFMEHIKANTLEDILVPKSDLWKIKIREVLDILHFLYKKYKFIHNDISTDNILMDDCYNIYIIDFELSEINGFWTQEFKMMIERLLDDVDIDFNNFLNSLESYNDDIDFNNYYNFIKIFMTYF